MKFWFCFVVLFVLLNCHIHSEAHSSLSASQRLSTCSAQLDNKVANTLHHWHHRTVAYKTRLLTLGSSFIPHRSSSSSGSAVVWAIWKREKLHLGTVLFFFPSYSQESTCYSSCNHLTFAPSSVTCRSCSYCAASAGSITTSGGARAGMATNSKLGSPISFLASQRKGFSKL